MSIEFLYQAGTALAAVAAFQSLKQAISATIAVRENKIKEKASFIGLPDNLQPNDVNLEPDSLARAIPNILREASKESRLQKSFVSSRPVTYAEYLSFLQETLRSSQFIDSAEQSLSLSASILKKALSKSLQRASAATNLDAPVVGVSWYEASAYCLWLSERTLKEYGHGFELFLFRLPKEDEWEKAAFSGGNLFQSWSSKRQRYLSDVKHILWADHLSVDVKDIEKTTKLSESIWEWCLTPNYKSQQAEEHEIGLIKKAIMGVELNAFTLISRGLKHNIEQNLPCTFRVVLDLNPEAFHMKSLTKGPNGRS